MSAKIRARISLMKTILKKLEALREHPEPDQQTFADAASYVREANEIAIQHGIEPLRVAEFINPIKAIAMVNRLMLLAEPERFLNVPEAAKVLSVSQAKIAEWIKANRLRAVNVANRGKRPQYRIAREDLLNLKPEQAAYKPKFL